jgi:hypothetical protein
VLPGAAVSRPNDQNCHLDDLSTDLDVLMSTIFMKFPSNPSTFGSNSNDDLVFLLLLHCINIILHRAAMDRELQRCLMSAQVMRDILAGMHNFDNSLVSSAVCYSQHQLKAVATTVDRVLSIYRRRDLDYRLRRLSSFDTKSCGPRLAACCAQDDQEQTGRFIRGRLTKTNFRCGTTKVGLPHSTSYRLKQLCASIYVELHRTLHPHGRMQKRHQLA